MSVSAPTCNPRTARLRLMHALVGLGASLCAKYDEPDKWLAGGCDCEPAIEGPYEAGGQQGIGCRDIRDALARVRARGVPAPTSIQPEVAELAGWSWGPAEDGSGAAAWTIHGRDLARDGDADDASAAEPQNTPDGELDRQAGTSRHFPAGAFSGGAPASCCDDGMTDEGDAEPPPRFAPDGARDERRPSA